MYSGGTPSMQSPEYWGGDIPFISAASMHDTFISKSDQYITQEGLQNGSKLLKKGNLLLLVRGSMLWNRIPACYNTIDVAFNQDVKGLVTNDKASPLFMLYWLQSKESALKYKVTGTGIGAGKLDSNDILDLRVVLPHNIEQSNIEKLLTQIDDRITTQNKIIEDLRGLKTVLCKKIFTQELHFPEFTDEWNTMILGEVCEKQASSISANKIEDNFGDYIIYGASGELKKIDFYEVENDYISIVKDGAGVGRLFYCEGKSSVLGTLDVIKPNKNANSYFLYCLLSCIDFSKYTTGSTIPHIYFKDYANEKIEIPTIEEQKKIANFLFAIDQKLEVEIAICNLLTKQKKYLLHQMFI